MPVPAQRMEAIVGLIRERLPAGFRDEARIVCVLSSFRDARELQVSWQLPDGERYYAVELLNERELAREPDSTQHQVIVRAIESLVRNIERANRGAIEQLVTKYGVTLRATPSPWTDQGLAYQGMGYQANQQSQQAQTASPKPPERDYVDRLLGDDLLD